MNVPLELIHRTRPWLDAEDLALTFVEEEVGRFDWANNLAKLKSEGTLERKVKAWLAATQVAVDPSEILYHLDKLTSDRTGRWL